MNQLGVSFVNVQWFLIQMIRVQMGFPPDRTNRATIDQNQLIRGMSKL